MKRRLLKLDAGRRIVTVGGRPAVLQEKSWQVLSMLLAGAPEVVSRRDIIDNVWQGNVRTGEKGLNQAVWAIRVALAESPREPRFIRTVPRVGYQWVHFGVPGSEIGESMPGRGIVRPLAGVAALAVVIMALTYITRSTFVSGVEPPVDSPNMVATNVYAVDRDIHVELANGCLRILRNANNTDIGTPMLSSDGTEVAVTVREPGSCRLVTIGVATGERRDFGSCPAT